jgi:hypothetical protein
VHECVRIEPIRAGSFIRIFLGTRRPDFRIKRTRHFIATAHTVCKCSNRWGTRISPSPQFAQNSCPISEYRGTTLNATRKWYENFKEVGKDLTRKDFIQLKSKFTTKKIAETFGVHYNTVYYKAMVLGFSEKHRASRKFKPPKNEANALYKKLSMAEIGKHYGVGETVVFMSMKEYGMWDISVSKARRQIEIDFS